MPTKSQHSRAYRPLPPFMKRLREEAGLNQRELGTRLGKPQSFIYKCESEIRRVDLTEFIAWARACGVDPVEAVARFIGAARRTV